MNKRGHVLNAALLAVGLGFLIEPAGSIETYVTILEVGVPIVLGALFPDVDTVFGRHRKTLHNLPVLAGFLAFPAVFGNLEFVWIGIFTHYVLDVAGSKRGIALFYPVWSREFGLPVGVAVGTRGSGVVTIVITAVELVVAAAALHWPPERAIELGEAAVRAAMG